MFDLSRIRESVKHEGRVSRRLFLAYASALSSIPLVEQYSGRLWRPRFKDNPFTLGVASGDPDHHGVVIWTKLAPKPLEPFGGMPNEAVQVKWEVSEDDTFSTTVATGTTIATPQLGHSVHVELNTLKPDRWYWYRFKAGDAESPVGRTRTMPLPNSTPEKIRFAVTSCQSYEQGLFTAYERMIEDDVDLVFHLGDYIYEYSSGRTGKIRLHHGDEIESLEDYRTRHNQYRSDPLLHTMHAQCPWLLTWDDHEFDNNCAGDISEQANVDPAEYLLRRANAYQAYYEMMPLRKRSIPRGPDMQLYRKCTFGRLADFYILDERQYRTDQPNNDRRSPLNEAAVNPENSLLGQRQKNWLSSHLIQSESNWNVLAQQVMMGTVGYRKDEESEPGYSMDQWPGYVHERNELMKFMADRRVPNPVVLTGDIHSNWANELRVNDLEHDTDPVAVEFVATSLSSGGNGVEKGANHDLMLADNPCVKFCNRERGYILCTVTPENWTSDYIVCDEVEKPGGKCFTRALFTVESGKSEINALA